PASAQFLTLSLHDALPICPRSGRPGREVGYERLNHAMPKVLGGANVVEMFARQNLEMWFVPVPFDEVVGSEFVAVPCRKNEGARSEEHTSELQSPYDLVCR